MNTQKKFLGEPKILVAVRLFMKAKILSFLLLTSIVLMPLNVHGENDETFTLSGFVFTYDGELANKTSIKVDSMASVWSENGSYTFSGSLKHTVVPIS